MFDTGLTPASFAGALAYLVAAGIALCVPRDAPGSRVEDIRRWRMVAMVFLALAGWRLGLGEIRLQEDVRTWAREHGIYGERHDGQAILTVAILAVAAAGLARVAFRGMPGRSAQALAAALGLVLLSLGRLASLHALDELLYRTGPFHLNYLVDLGLTALAAGLAWSEIARTRHRPSSGRRGWRS